MANGGRTGEISPSKVAAATVRSGRERERGTAGNRFPEMETLILKLAIYSKFFSISVDHIFSIRTQIYACFVSTNSIQRPLQLP